MNMIVDKPPAPISTADMWNDFQKTLKLQTIDHTIQSPSNSVTQQIQASLLKHNDHFAAKVMNLQQLLSSCEQTTTSLLSRRVQECNAFNKSRSALESLLDRMGIDLKIIEFDDLEKACLQYFEHTYKGMNRCAFEYFPIRILLNVEGIDRQGRENFVIFRLFKDTAIPQKDGEAQKAFLTDFMYLVERNGRLLALKKGERNYISDGYGASFLKAILDLTKSKTAFKRSSPMGYLGLFARKHARRIDRQVNKFLRSQKHKSDYGAEPARIFPLLKESPSFKSNEKKALELMKVETKGAIIQQCFSGNHNKWTVFLRKVRCFYMAIRTIEKKFFL